MFWVLSDLLAQLSEVEIGSGFETNIKPNFADVVSCQDAGRISSRLTDNDAIDDDDTAFTHSGALTIKSSPQSLDSFFSSGSTLGQFAESSFTNSSHFEPAVVNNNNYNNNGSFNPSHITPMRQSTDSSGSLPRTDFTLDLQTFLLELGLGKYADIFDEQDVDLPMFLTLTEDDLKEVGIR